jgi:hypothetical protein
LILASARSRQIQNCNKFISISIFVKKISYLITDLLQMDSFRLQNTGLLNKSRLAAKSISSYIGK